MWVIFGNKLKTERVPNGRKIERACSACGETAMFYERRATTTFQVYFLDVYDYKTQRVMACGACGALFATDELGGAGEPVAEVTPGKVLDSVFSAAERAGKVIQEGAARAIRTLGDEIDDLASGGATEPRRSSGTDASEGEHEVPRREGEPRVMSAEDAELLARFEALERAKKQE